MATTDKYDLEEVPVGTTGWNAILTSNMQKIDDYVHARIMAQIGEAFSQYEAGYVEKNGKVKKARADRVRMPCIGLAVEAGILDATIRFQRVGLITNGSWTWTPGKAVWLHPTTRGGLTQTKPAFAQLVGIAKSATSILLELQIPWEWDFGTTTTTTTTTCSSTTTTTA